MYSTENIPECQSYKSYGSHAKNAIVPFSIRFKDNCGLGGVLGDFRLVPLFIHNFCHHQNLLLSV